MNSLWDIRIFLGLVPKESPCTKFQTDVQQADHTDYISSTLEIKSSERNEQIMSEYNEIKYSTSHEVLLCFINDILLRI